jgi:hypothetical protein
MQQKTRPDGRRGCNMRVAIPPVELGFIVRFGDVPVVLGSLRDPFLVRGAIEAAIQNAGPADDVPSRQKMKLLTSLLRRSGNRIGRKTAQGWQAARRYGDQIWLTTIS